MLVIMFDCDQIMHNLLMHKTFSLHADKDLHADRYKYGSINQIKSLMIFNYNFLKFKVMIFVIRFSTKLFGYNLCLILNA